MRLISHGSVPVLSNIKTRGAPKNNKMGEHQGNKHGGEMHGSRRDKMATHRTCSTQRARSCSKVTDRRSGEA